MGYTIDIDTGGTFTDGFFVRDGRVETVKVPTTPHDLTVCFLECVKAGALRFGVSVEDMLYETEIIRFSNTIGTNTIIQRDGSKVGLLVTLGREGLAPTGGDGKAPLVYSDMVVGIKEAVSNRGEVLQEPDEAEVMGAAQLLIDRGARCLVVAFAHSEFNPANERMVRRVVKREYSRDFLGSVPVFLSSDISRRSGERERINAAVLNAYIHAKLVRLLYKAGEELRQRLYQRSLFIVHNNGAVARVAKTRAINTYNSGPAAGLLGARLIGRLYGVEDLISADMGGTSFDLGYVKGGQASYTVKPDVEGFPVNVPMLAIRAIGAGGGSIASVKEGVLSVGPQSAGALPGPVCFDLGGVEPTVTDADVVLGILDPDYFLGGSFKLNRSKAVSAIEEKVAKPLGVSVEEAALAIKSKVDENMGREIVKFREEAGTDGEPLLVVCGGAGPAHCCHIARIAGLKKIVITPFSAVFSAFSSSSMDVGHLYYRRVDIPFDGTVDLGVLAEPVASMRGEAERDMRGEGFSLEEVSFGLELFVRGKDAENEVKIGAEVDFFRDKAKAGEVMDQARSTLGSSDAILSTVGLWAQAPMPHYEIKSMPPAEWGIDAARKGSRRMYLDSGGAQEVPVYERSKLMNGHQLKGPAVVESEQTTLLIPLGWRFRVDEYDNAIIEEA
jgi:N-methylhydantoinase A